MSITNEVNSVVLWYLNGCSATFYKAQDEDQKKRKVVDTVTFTNKAYLAYRQVNSLVSTHLFKHLISGRIIEYALS